MKIIGTYNDGFIVTVSYDEIANLIGFHSAYSDKANIRALKADNEIKVHAMYTQLYYLSDIKRKLSDARKSLLECAETIHETTNSVPVVTAG